MRKVDQKISASEGKAEADDLAPSVGVDGHGDYRCHRDDPTAVADLQVGRIQPEIGPFAFERPLQEGTHALIDLLTQLGDLGLADARESHRLDELVDTAGRDPSDPSLLDHGDQRLLAHLPRLQEWREVGTLPKLGNPQLQLAQPGVERAVPIAISVVQPLGRALVPSGTDQPFHIALH